MDYPNVTYSDAIKSGPGEHFARVRRATEMLAGIMGDYFPAAKVEWEPDEQDQASYIITVEMPEWDGTGRAQLTPTELADKSQTRDLLHQLWGDILRVYNHRLLKKLAAIRGD